MNQLGISLSKNNTSINYIENRCRSLLYKSLIELNIIYPTQNKSIERYITRLFMPHSISHSIGIEVHDVLDDDILKTNMVITIEPGVYFYKSHLYHPNINKQVWNLYKDIGGVRIEDVILINENKSTILSNFEKEANEIEDLINLM